MKPINILDPDKTLLVRQSLLLAFFVNRPMPDVVDGVASALDEWLTIVPPDNIKWALVGSSATQHSPVTSRTLGQCRSMLDKAKAAARPITAFRLFGPEKYNPAFRFVAVGDGNLVEKETRDVLVEISLPWEITDSLPLESLVEFSMKIAGALPYDSGYFSAALNWGKESKKEQAATAMIGPAMRHPGLDIHNNSSTRLRLGKLTRGARWITFLGADVVRTLGGAEHIVGQLDSAVTALNVGAGLALRSGRDLAIGDVNRKDDLPLLRSVARAIEPATYFNDRLIQTGMFPENAEAYLRWERRLLS